MDKDYLVLKRASASRQSGEWSEDDFERFRGKAEQHLLGVRFVVVNDRGDDGLPTDPVLRSDSRLGTVSRSFNAR